MLARGRRLLLKNEDLQARIAELENYEGPPSSQLQAERERLQMDLQLQASRLSQLMEEKEALGSQLEEAQAQRASLEEALSEARSAQQTTAAQLETAMAELSIRGKSISRLEKALAREREALAQERDSRAQYEAGEGTRRLDFVNSDEFQVKLGPMFTDMLVFGAEGTYKQLRRGGHLKSDTLPSDAVNIQEIIDQVPEDFVGKFT